MKRLLHYSYYDDTTSLLLDNPSEELVDDIKRFYGLRCYLKLKYDVVVSEVIYMENLINFEQWKEDELLCWNIENDNYEGEQLEVVQRLLSY